MTVGIGIIGLTQSGRTTVFNALTGGHSDTKSHYQEVSRMGVAKVPEPRLDKLAGLLKPKKVVPAEVKYLDLSASVKSLAKDSAISGELLTQLSNTDALINIIRSFTDESIPHPEGSIDIRRDIEAMKLESLDETTAAFMNQADAAHGVVLAMYEQLAKRRPVGGNVTREGGRLRADVEFDDGSTKSVSAVKEKGGLKIVPTDISPE